MTVKIKFANRTETGKGKCRKLRAKGMVPVVFYGPGYRDSVVGTVDIRELSPIANAMNWETSMIDLEMPDGRVEMALLRSVQRHAITRNILHVDLYQLVKDQKVKVAIPIRVINKEITAGVKMGGVLEQPLREVDIFVLPTEIPSEIVLDTVQMALGDEIFVRDIKMPESAEVVTSMDLPVVIIARPKATAEETDEEAAEDTAEVEVVGKGKRKDEED